MVLKPDVIVVAAVSESLSALKRETSTIPIVFTQIHDPVASGFVASLARPGGNLTGFSLFDASTAAKWLELLRQIAPSVTRAGIIYDPGSPSSRDLLPAIEPAAPSLGLRLTRFGVRNAAEIERAVGEFAADAGGGLIVVPGSVIVVHRELIVARVEVQWTVAEIAQRFGMRTVDATRMAVSRAVRRLTDQMKALSARESAS